MAALHFLLVSLLAVQVFGDAPAPNDLQELIKNGRAKFDKALEDMNKQIGLSKDPTGAEIVKLIRDQNDKLANNMKDIGKKIEEQIKANPDATEVLNTMKAKLNDLSVSLKKENPEMAQTAQKLGDAMKNAWDNLAQEMEKGYKEFNKKGGKRDEIDDLFKNIIDKGTAAAKELQSKVDEAIKKH